MIPLKRIFNSIKFRCNLLLAYLHTYCYWLPKDTIPFWYHGYEILWIAPWRRSLWVPKDTPKEKYKHLKYYCIDCAKLFTDLKAVDIFWEGVHKELADLKDQIFRVK